MKDIKHQLEIALAIKQKTLIGLAKEWGISDTHLRETARGNNVSAPLRAKIVEFILEALKELPNLVSKEKIAA